MKRRITILGVFLLVLIPGLFCAGKKEKTEMTVLIRMMDIQDLWFRQKMKEFEKQNQVKLNIVTFDQIEDVKGMIELEMLKLAIHKNIRGNPKQKHYFITDFGRKVAEVLMGFFDQIP